MYRNGLNDTYVSLVGWAPPIPPATPLPSSASIKPEHKTLNFYTSLLRDYLFDYILHKILHTSLVISTVYNTTRNWCIKYEIAKAISGNFCPDLRKHRIGWRFLLSHLLLAYKVQCCTQLGYWGTTLMLGLNIVICRIPQITNKAKGMILFLIQ